MRSGKSFLIMLVVAAGLGSYIYFVEMKREPASASIDVPVKEKVFTVAPGTIEEVEITATSSEVTRATKKESNWSLVAPVAVEADQGTMGNLASTLESLERNKVIEENPASAAPFGLSPPRIRLAFKTAGDATPKVLLIGNKTPTGGDLYAKVDGAPAVFLIGGHLEDVFNRKPFDLREKTALKFTRDAVNAVTVVGGSTRVALEKTGTDWQFSGGGKADGAVVDALLSQLEQARMTSLAKSETSPAALKEHGLDKPQILIAIGAGSAKAELAIGKKEDDTHFFARDLSRPIIFGVDKALFDGMTVTADTFRIKDVFAFRSFTARGLDITFGGQTYTFAKKKAEGADALEKWSQTAPAEKVVDAAKFDDFLMTMSNLRAESFPEKALTGGESITLTARFGDAAALQTETVTLRKVGTVVHATRAGVPGALAVFTADFDRALGLFKEITGAK